MTRLLTYLLCLAFGVGVGLMLASSGPEQHDDHGGSVYRCPMHPTIVSETPAACPVCGMDLVEDAPSAISDASGATVAVDPATRQSMGVRTALVERKDLQREIRAAGRVAYDETKMSDVNTKVPGWIETLHVDFTGRHVALGEPLLEIYSPELVAAQEEHLTAIDYLKRLEEQQVSDDVLRGARELGAASAQRLRYLDVSDSQIRQLERSGNVSRTVMLESPQEGVVVHKAVLQGAYVRAGEHLYRIADVQSVWIYANLFERDLPWVEEGQSATVTLPQLPGRTLTGRVSHVFPFVDAQTRSVRARLVFDNAEGLLKPDMFADIVIHAPAVADALVVPVQAVIHTGERRVVIVDLGEGRYEPRDVRVGLETGDDYEILSGVAEGERIVLSAQFLIDSESHLTSAMSGMAGDGHAGH